MDTIGKLETCIKENQFVLKQETSQIQPQQQHELTCKSDQIQETLKDIQERQHALSLQLESIRKNQEWVRHLQMYNYKIEFNFKLNVCSLLSF